MSVITERKFAVVTGASSGIGFELAKVFAENEFNLLVVAEDSAISDAKEAIANVAPGAVVEALQVDLSNYEGVEKVCEAIRHFGRPVDAIAINAGVGVSGDFARETDLAEEINLINLNIVSAVHLTKRVVRDMCRRGEGKIMFTSSIASVAPGPFFAVYAASKAFIQSFAQSIRNELKDSGVTVTSLMPGPTDTEFFERAGMEDTKVGASEKDDPAVVARQGFEAMMTGDDHVIAGAFMNKLQGVMSKFLTEPMKAEQQRKQTEPGSAHH